MVTVCLKADQIDGTHGWIFAHQSCVLRIVVIFVFFSAEATNFNVLVTTTLTILFSTELAKTFLAFKDFVIADVIVVVVFNSSCCSLLTVE